MHCNRRCGTCNRNEQRLVHRQQDAIDRITGLANDLATNMNGAIDRLNKSRGAPDHWLLSEYLMAERANRNRPRE